MQGQNKDMNEQNVGHPQDNWYGYYQYAMPWTMDQYESLTEGLVKICPSVHIILTYSNTCYSHIE